MTFGADLVVLAVDEHRGEVRLSRQLGFALAAAELVDLAVARRIESAGAGIRVVEKMRTGDPVLDETLAHLGVQYQYQSIAKLLAARAPDRVVVHVAAMLESGELDGELVQRRPGRRPEPSGLRVAEAGRRDLLARRLADVAAHAVDLEDEAFGALAFVAGIPDHVLSGLTRFRVHKRLKDLVGWFTDTWRYLPGVPGELALGDDDVEPGGVNPAAEEPWRLLIRLAVQEAAKPALTITRKSQRESGLSKDVQMAADIAYVWENTP